ncbi:chalcone synthase [Salinibacter sp. 10B]|uniref:type III polyketide synthase n=1 Tax=Salinibacter sp. 10B TaxID=1923971 RepID=UPI000CF3F9F9|nr:type III polyketide synthase [Salinibacter sp. 10B]PQJ33302.1 chalcone synthase [Salinibacter sp. 10B]
MTYTVLDAIATGNPPLRRTQEEAAEFMSSIETLPDALQSRLPALYRGSSIDSRYTCVDDYGKDSADEFTFFPKTWTLEPAPTTEERNEHYRASAVPLAEDVGGRALEQAGVEAKDVTHVIAVSCTGFFAPGLDVELVKRLGLPPTTQRTFIGFMGCYAAFNAMRVAHGFCQSQSDARVLVVCTELCTLHFQIEESLESVIVNSLFSDGAAAAVFSSRSEEEANGRLAYIDGRCHLDDDSMEDMTWAIGDTGFKMGLSSRVPDVVGENLPGYVDNLLSPHDVGPDDLDFWAIHPGGRRIVEGAQDTLGLSDADVADSLAILRQYGNMSSPTILFVLKRILDRQAEGDGAPPAHGLAMAFGPGLTIEGALFQRV